MSKEPKLRVLGVLGGKNYFEAIALNSQPIAAVDFAALHYNQCAKLAKNQQFRLSAMRYIADRHSSRSQARRDARPRALALRRLDLDAGSA